MVDDEKDPVSGAPRGNGADGDPAAETPSGVDDRAALASELEATKERWLRAQADLENYKKRAQRERQEALRYGSEGLLRELLPVIDNLERALEHARSLPAAGALVEGLELVRRGMIETLERHGVRPVEAHGTAFDPNVHQAIEHVESEHPPNTIVGEHQRGYALHDRLLRPALVSVGKGRGGGERDVETTDDDG
jgi:molecular chaperone GrpE